MSWRYRVDGGREQQTLSCVICVTSDFACSFFSSRQWPSDSSKSRRSREDAQVINCNSSMLPRERYRLEIFCFTRVTVELREHSRSHHRLELAFLCFFVMQKWLPLERRCNPKICFIRCHVCYAWTSCFYLPSVVLLLELTNLTFQLVTQRW